MNIEKIYEDENVVCVNKPSGLLVHQDGITKKKTLSDWILENYPETANVGEDLINQKGYVIKKPGIVHRIDRETSGAIIITKNSDTYNFIKKQFQDRSVKKIYRAIVYGEIKEREIVIDLPIGRSKKDSRKRTTYEKIGPGIRDAKTTFYVLKKYEGATYIEAIPYTGRTHQIRVHAHSLGNPVYCDYVYAKKRECPKTLGRLALHAFSIEFLLPNNTKIKVEASEPKEFSEFLDTLSSL